MSATIYRLDRRGAPWHGAGMTPASPADKSRYASEEALYWDMVASVGENVCFACRVKVPKTENDHIRPVSQGGSNRLSNRQPLCPGCNSTKSAEHTDYRPEPFRSLLVEMAGSDAPGVPETCWMTYEELGKARGISRASAERMVRRHKWRRQVGNTGLVRALVPTDAILFQRGGNNPDIEALRATVETLKLALERTLFDADKAPDINALRQSFDAALSGVRERAERAEQRAERAEARVSELEQAEAARQARGRWARLRAAWRG